MNITVTLTERELVIRFNGLIHFRADRRELMAMQSWIVNKGRDTPMYQICFYSKSGPRMVLEYDKHEVWEGVLKKLSRVSFLNEWEPDMLAPGD